MNEDRVIISNGVRFNLSGWDGQNRSGIDPVCDKVVVRVHRAMTMTAGGIHLTDDMSDRQTLASTTGVLVAVGPQAFKWDTDRAHRWEGAAPEPGMRVCFQKYAGQEYTGLDGEMYRVMQDRSVAGTQGVAERVAVAPAMEIPADAPNTIVSDTADAIDMFF